MLNGFTFAFRMICARHSHNGLHDEAALRHQIFQSISLQLYCIDKNII